MVVNGFVERRQEQLDDEKNKQLANDRMEAFFHWKFCEKGYTLLKDEGFSRWFECPVCNMKFESDDSGMNCISVITEGTGPTGKGRTQHLEPACPKCFKLTDGKFVF